MGKPLNEKQIRWIVRDEMHKILGDASHRLNKQNRPSEVEPSEEDKAVVKAATESAFEGTQEAEPVTKQDVIAALGKAGGKARVLEILGQFNATKVSELDPSDYADIVEVARERKAS